MSDLKSNGYAIDILENEGVDYAIRHYTSGSIFKDPETAKLWDAADLALNALINYLEDDTGRDVEV